MKLLRKLRPEFFRSRAWKAYWKAQVDLAWEDDE